MRCCNYPLFLHFEIVTSLSCHLRNQLNIPTFNYCQIKPCSIIISPNLWYSNHRITRSILQHFCEGLPFEYIIRWDRLIAWLFLGWLIPSSFSFLPFQIFFFVIRTSTIWYPSLYSPGSVDTFHLPLLALTDRQQTASCLLATMLRPTPKETQTTPSPQSMTATSTLRTWTEEHSMMPKTCSDWERSRSWE